ncbi:MAG: hypothetical protein ABIK09_18580 [Pseudomonadota bacterium]
MKPDTKPGLGPRWLAPILAIFPAALACIDVGNRDIGFHVATGRAIDLLGEVPRTNVLSFTNPNHPWILHQWIPAYLYHRVDVGFGAAGLVGLKALVVFATFTILWLALRRRTATWGGAALWFALAASTAFPRFLVRPFIFSMLGLAVFLWGLTFAPAAGARLREWRPFLIITTAAAALTSILHAGFVYLWIVALAWAAGVGVDAVLPRPDRDPDRWRRVGLAAAWLAGMAVASALLLTLANPYGVEVLLLPFRFSTDAWFHAHLVEYRPPPFLPSLFPGLWGSLLLGAAVLMGSALVRARRGGLGGAHVFGVLALGAFSWLVLKHQRIMYPYALVAAFVAAPWTDDLLCLLRGRARRVAVTVAVAAAVALSIYSVHLWATHGSPGFGLDDRQHPGRLLAFVEEQDLPDPTFVSDAWGGTWLWEFYPARRTFVDNRLEAYPPEFYKDVYQSIRYGEDGWEEKLATYGVKTAVLKYGTQGEINFLEGRPSLRQRMLEDEDWRLVYWDDLGEIFVRRDAVPAGCDRCADTRHFDPDRMEGARPTLHLVTAEAEEVLEKSGPSVRAYTALIMSHWVMGRNNEAALALKEALEAFPGNAELEGMRPR